MTACLDVRRSLLLLPRQDSSADCSAQRPLPSFGFDAISIDTKTRKMSGDASDYRTAGVGFAHTYQYAHACTYVVHNSISHLTHLENIYMHISVFAYMYIDIHILHIAIRAYMHTFMYYVHIA